MPVARDTAAAGRPSAEPPQEVHTRRSPTGSAGTRPAGSGSHPRVLASPTAVGAFAAGNMQSPAGTPGFTSRRGSVSRYRESPGGPTTPVLPRGSLGQPELQVCVSTESSPVLPGGKRAGYPMVSPPAAMIPMRRNQVSMSPPTRGSVAAAGATPKSGQGRNRSERSGTIVRTPHHERSGFWDEHAEKVVRKQGQRPRKNSSAQSPDMVLPLVGQVKELQDALTAERALHRETKDTNVQLEHELEEVSEMLRLCSTAADSCIVWAEAEAEARRGLEWAQLQGLRELQLACASTEPIAAEPRPPTPRHSPRRPGPGSEEVMELRAEVERLRSALAKQNSPSRRAVLARHEAEAVRAEAEAQVVELQTALHSSEALTLKLSEQVATLERRLRRAEAAASEHERTSNPSQQQGAVMSPERGPSELSGSRVSPSGAPAAPPQQPVGRPPQHRGSASPDKRDGISPRLRTALAPANPTEDDRRAAIDRGRLLARSPEVAVLAQSNPPRPPSRTTSPAGAAQGADGAAGAAAPAAAAAAPSGREGSSRVSPRPRAPLKSPSDFRGVSPRGRSPNSFRSPRPGSHSPQPARHSAGEGCSGDGASQRSGSGRCRAAALPLRRPRTLLATPRPSTSRPSGGSPRPTHEPSPRPTRNASASLSPRPIFRSPRPSKQGALSPPPPMRRVTPALAGARISRSQGAAPRASSAQKRRSA
eukprot:TRINITY_DN17933_c0_g1_i1.p1 TRINITY_DN17933_c0_g1~~TRINITY_DN17933_c0_g1_i1.p1  ORF type:complete len:706 (+),score=158.67 TRINITY_DN17933_c0_g1_i1:102-2219(+)